MPLCLEVNVDVVVDRSRSDGEMQAAQARARMAGDSEFP